ncbi:MAG: hypothetical protein JST22_15160 [Bacteroidetes bacterium]|nr:hypothetical protein [Bacteroidota bacterium]
MSTEEQSAVAQLLLHCEEPGGPAPPYVVEGDTYREARGPFFGESLPVRTQPIPYDARGGEIFVVSDLHIAAGRTRAGVYKGTENFFADDSFLRFVNHIHRKAASGNALLVINGDIFDFLRITEHPGSVHRARLSKRLKHALKLEPIQPHASPQPNHVADQYNEWSLELAKVGIAMTPAQLEASISARERKIGLGTTDFKTIYRLIRVRHGHPAFIQALSFWMEHGHRLMVLKGNHDLELYWPAVRNYMRLLIAEDIVARNPAQTVADVLRNVVLPNITFVDDSVLIDGDFYVEHGHRYDKFTMVLDSPVLARTPTQINIPFGSFFNRYLINRVELFFPFLDNVRPSGNVLPMLMKANFPLGLKVLFQHIPLLVRVLFTNPRYVWFMLHKVFWFALVLGVPAIYLVLAFAHAPIIDTITNAVSNSKILTTIVGQLKPVAMLFLSYVLARVVAWFQLEEPDSLSKYARIRFEGTDYRLMTMGHTHNPGEYVFTNGQRFYNTGTWIPVIEISTASVREDRTYTFLHLVRDDHGKLQPLPDGLQRWNDDADRADMQVLLERK